MYQLHIPYIPSLASLSMPEVANALEDGGVRFTVESLNWPAEFPYRPLTVVTAAHTDDTLFIDFLVRCNYLRAENYLDNSPVSEDSCVEVYLQPDPQSDRYFTFEFNCVGVLNSAICSQASGCAPLPEDQLKRVRRYASVGPRPFREVEGSFIWSVAVAIPLDIMELKYAGSPLLLRGNFNKCASATSQPHYLSWVPISSAHPDFHHPESFGKIILD